MPNVGRLLAYVVAGVPAAIGVWFVARFAFITSDTAIDGASNAFLFGMIAVGAYAGPAVAIIVWGNGRKKAAAFLWAVTLLAMVTNWSQTLGAVANRGAGTEAERVKAADAIKDDRKRLAQLDREREAMKFAATDAAAVRAAEAAVNAAEASRQRECGNGEPKQRGLNCRTRETEEAARRETLTTALANKALTDQAAKLDTEAAAIRARLKTAHPVKEGNSLGEALGHILPISAATAATAQQGMISAIVELLIAVTLALPELLTGRPLAKRPTETPEAEPTIAAPPKPHLVASAPTRAGSVPEIMADTLEPSRGKRVELEDVFKAYVMACRTRGESVLAPEQFIDPLQRFCRECGIPTQTRGGRVYLLGVQLAGATAKASRPTKVRKQ